MTARARSLCLACALACVSCSARPPAPVMSEPEHDTDAGRGDVGPLVWVGRIEDRIQTYGENVKLGGDSIHTDGQPDYAFKVRLSGPAVSLTFTLSDLRGKRVGGSIWDTITGDTPIPPVLDVPMKLGMQTANLAVYDRDDHLLNPYGSLPPNTVFDGSWYTLVLPDWGSEFRDEGRAFTLLVLRPDGRVDRTTVVIV